MVANGFQDIQPEHKDALASNSSSQSAKEKFSEEFLQEQKPQIANLARVAQPSDLSNGSGPVQLSTGAPRITGFMQEPGDGEVKVEQAIRGAQKSVDMWMFHLSDPAAVQALIDAHDNNHAEVSVILDRNQLSRDPNAAGLAQKMKDDGIDVVQSSDQFTITHPKTFVIDGKSSFITSMNLTRALPGFRDFGVSTDDPMIQDDLDRLFQADLKNAQNNPNTKDTPAPISPFLVVSPIEEGPDLAALDVDASKIKSALSSLPNEQQAAAAADYSRASAQYSPMDQLNAELDLAKMQNGAQLVQLFAQKMKDENINHLSGIIDRAQSKVVGETENIGAPAVLDSIINAAKRGVEVDLVIPGSSFGVSGEKNAQAVQKLQAAEVDIEKQGLPGIHIKEMPPLSADPKQLQSNPDQPYVHAKWLVADNEKEAYLGSVNFTPNSLYGAREIGLIFDDAPAMHKMVDAFNQDWTQAVEPPQPQK